MRGPNSTIRGRSGQLLAGHSVGGAQGEPSRWGSDERTQAGALSWTVSKTALRTPS